MKLIRDVPAGLHHLFDFGEPVVRPEVVAAARDRIEREGAVHSMVLALALLENTSLGARMDDRFRALL
jgi:hypothetical protein